VQHAIKVEEENHNSTTRSFRNLMPACSLGLPS
jgi:hypothetical protein